MTTLEKLEYLTSICKESVSIFINERYRGAGQTVKDYITESGYNDIDISILEEMIKRDLTIEVIAYPGTQVGSYKSIHFDLDSALDDVIKGCKEYHKIS